MQIIPLSIVRITPEEEELIAFHRMLSPSVQAAIAMLIAANMHIPTQDERESLIQPEALRLVSSK